MDTFFEIVLALYFLGMLYFAWGIREIDDYVFKKMFFVISWPYVIYLLIKTKFERR